MKTSCSQEVFLFSRLECAQWLLIMCACLGSYPEVQASYTAPLGQERWTRSRHRLRLRVFAGWLLRDGVLATTGRVS